MTRFLKYTICCLVYFGIVQTSVGQDLSLREAKNYLLIENGHYKASEFVVKKAEEEKGAAKGLRYPTLSINGRYLHLQNDIAVNLNPQRDILAGILDVSDPTTLGDWNRVLQGKNFGFANSEINLPLFTGGKINAANSAAKIRLDIANEEKDDQLNELTIQLIDSYFRSKLANHVLTLRQEALETVSVHKDQADKLYENGVIPEVETINAQVAYSNAFRDEKAAQKDVNLASTALQNLLGDAVFDTLTTPFYEPRILPPLTHFQDRVLTENDKLKLLESNKQLADVGVDAEKSAYYPELGAVASYRFLRQNFQIGQTDWYAGLGLNWTLFNGFQREHKIKAAKHTKSQLEVMETQTRRDLQTYVEFLYNTLKKQQEQYESLANDQRLAEKLKFMRTRAFQEGYGTSLEVMDATLNLSRTQVLKAQALYEYSKAYGELMVVTGDADTFINNQ